MGKARLLREPPEPVGVARKRGRQNLDRHLASEPRVSRPIHLAHPTGRHKPADLVRANPLAWL